MNNFIKKFFKPEFCLQDVKDPNLLRDIYPYTSVPRIIFDNKTVPVNLQEDFWITCSTFRDGQQSRTPYTVKQIVRLYDFLHRLGTPDGIIKQCEFFVYSKKDREAVEKCQEKNYQYPEITGWITAKKSDFRLIREMKLKETGILTPCSDYHIFLKLNKTRKEILHYYLDLIKDALELGILPRCHLEDITRADIFGFVLPLIEQIMKLSDESGVPIKIRLCDTLGYGVPCPEVALPRSVPKLLHTIIHETGFPGERMEWHGHNDFHKALINASTAWLYGCTAANGTLFGFGERTGNSAIEGLIMEYISLKKSSKEIDLTIITEIADYFQKEIGIVIPSNYPFVGASFNTTRTGMHADGASKNEEIYNIFDTNRLLNRPFQVTVTDKSGIPGIAYWVNTFLNLKEDQKIDQNHPGIVAIAKWVEQQYRENRITGISDEEMLGQAKRHLPMYFESDLDRIKKRASELVTELIMDIKDNEKIVSMDPAIAEPFLEKVIMQEPFIQFIYIVDINGKKITRDITRAEDQEKFEKKNVGWDFSNREWFKIPVKTGKIHVTDLYSSRITDKLCITVSASIKNKKNEIVGILGIDMRFEDLTKL